jgi:predicted peroxiredoxin
MKKITVLISLMFAFAMPTLLSANSAKGLNVALTAKDAQTQMMAMVLSMMTLKEGKAVNMVLCSSAGDLAVKNMKSPVLKPMDKSPKMMLQALIKKGANVQVCPLYLPNANKDASVLLKGISVAKPPMIAKQLLNKEFQNLSY